MAHNRNVILGWDVGGAHLKAVLLDADGTMLQAAQLPCPLWQGMGRLRHAVAAMLDKLACKANPSMRHAITMTGELADIFPDRGTGVRQIVDVMTELLGAETSFYAGKLGFLQAAEAVGRTADIASANWLASAQWLAAEIGHGLLVDVGSTTADLIPFVDGKPQHRGLTDAERLQCEELVYSGVVRTPLMALGPRVPFQGEWRPLIAEHFATAADVYRLTGELDATDDMAPAADGAGKTLQDSARRLARMLGHDLDDAPQADWQALAQAFRQQQIDLLKAAALRCFSRGILPDNAPLIGAGAGRFVVAHLARQLGRPFVDVDTMIRAHSDESRRWAGICLPAYAVARLNTAAVACKDAA